MINKKQNLVCYCHAPVSPNVQGLHLSLFRLIEAFKKEYNVYVISRSLECYEFYMRRFKNEHPEINFVSVPNNISDNIYSIGILEQIIDNEIGHIDSAFWFSSGMSSVTSEKLMKNIYDDLKTKKLNHNSKIVIQNQVDSPVLYEAELLYSILKYNPVFNYRVVDYTEVPIHKITGYPMKLLCFYPNNFNCTYSRYN